MTDSNPLIVLSLSPIPISLERTDDHYYIKYSLQHHDEFVTWWRNTEWFLNHNNATKPYGVPSFNKKAKISPVWKDFTEVAHYENGQTKILCNRCNMLMEHPNYNNGGGTSGLGSHVKTTRCKQQYATRTGRGQLTLVDSINTGNVSRDLNVLICEFIL